jgi:hypothetical protein
LPFFAEFRFRGCEVTVQRERSYVKCAKAAAKIFQGIAQTKPKVKFGDPIQFEPGVLGDVPTYARLNQYARAQRAVELAYMAHAVLPKEIANAITVSLISDVPALQAAVAIQASREKEGQDLPHIRWRYRVTLKTLVPGKRRS